MISFDTSIFWWLSGLTYHGKAADVWALGCTLYCMVLGTYPFKGDNLQSTYDKVYTIILFALELCISLFLLGTCIPCAWETTFSRELEDIKNVGTV